MKKRKDEPISYESTEGFANDGESSKIEAALMKEKKKLVKRLRAQRIKLAMTQVELAKRMGSKQPSIARMESGSVGQVSMDLLIKAAFALQIPYNIKNPRLENRPM